MKTIELMNTEPCAVRAAERLDAAARVLWEEDCGIVPVVDGTGVLVGVVTDRDLCMASYTKGCALTEIPVSAVMARDVATCRPDEPVSEIMQTMQRQRVHRLPVVDALGKLIGVVSTNDLVRASHARPAAVDPTAVVRTLATIGAPRRQALAVVAGTARSTGAAGATGETKAKAKSKSKPRPKPKAPKKKQAARSSGTSGRAKKATGRSRKSG